MAAKIVTGGNNRTNDKEDRMARLIQLVNGVAASKFPLDGDLTTIGRAPDNDIEVDDLAVSAQHAAIERLGDAETAEFHVHDLQSTNGTFVNEEPVTSRRLHNRDVLRIGWSHFEFIDERATLERTAKIRKTWIPGVFVSKK
jgi:pSer/pThr/pTyr-binding forkhead associated (FHA) protein